MRNDTRDSLTISLERGYEVTSLLIEVKTILKKTRKSHEDFPLLHELNYILEKEVNEYGT